MAQANCISFVAGIPADTNSFTDGIPTHLQAPVPVDFGELFSREACDRLMPGLRVLATAFNGLPGMIPLHGGLPPQEAFPLSSMQLTLKDGTTININDPSEVAISENKSPITNSACWEQYLEAEVYVKGRLHM